MTRVLQLTLLLALLFGCAGRGTPSAAEALDAHPGEITFIDHGTGETKIRDAAEVPETIAWATVGGERVAVVRVESRVMGDRREIQRYTADGTMVDSTVSTPRPPPPR
ncbi:MAG: hypothetical protein AAFV53_42895 [Myxococcota bacterium]